MGGLRKILIVEDSIELRDIYKLFFTQKGFEVETALDGEAGLEKAKEFQPDLVFIDIMMPKKDGYEVLKELRHNPQYGCTQAKLVILTNLGDASKVSPEVSQDMDGYVIKAEVDLPDLLEVIESLGEENNNPGENHG
jgi:DNA-binding response OmpR family regulator